MSAQEDFADLKFRIECSEMVLTRAGGTPLVVSGPGEIWQDDDGLLQFKIFTAPEGYRGLAAYMRRPRTIGQAIPDEDFFTLEAHVHTGARWSSQRILPASRGGALEGLAHGYLRELNRAEEIPSSREHDYVVLRFKKKLEFPCNHGTETIIRVGGQDRRRSNTLNAAFIHDADYRFEIVHEHEHTAMSLQLPPSQLTSATPSRIREALQFVLGRQLALMVVETSAGGVHTTRLISPSADRGRGEMPPPLRFHRFDEGGHVWRIFTTYFRHIHSNTEAGWHPISRHVGRALEATAASLDTEILALAVAVEGLMGECFPTLAPVAPAFLTELDAVQAALRGVELTDQTRRRIEGSLNAMRSPRNTDSLRNFIVNNHLALGLYDSWTRLRHTSAHGGGTGGRDIETILQLRHEVLHLLYSIVLAAIGYTGPRTDYSLPGCPMRIWPVPPPP